VPNATLLESGVLCPLNPSFDESGYFDVPADLLQQVTGQMGLTPPGVDATPLALRQYALTFNAHVMSNERIVEFLAERLGSRLSVLGKTVVFTPNIATANRLAARIYDRFPDLRGSIAAVHSKMAEVQIPGQEGATVQEVLAEFHARGSKPSLLINVDMLTEGFDDPKIQTVVLARLTLSTNRFWQMIGRGTRGPACGGTSDCCFLDPIKLVRLYDYFNGYQPAVRGGPPVENEDEKPAEVGRDRLSPEISITHMPPDPAVCRYEVTPELARIQQQVAAALADFLRPMAEAMAVDAARCARVDLTDGRPQLRPSTTFEGQTATAILLGQIASLERRSGHDLSWTRRALPHPMDEVLLRHQLRRLRAIEELKLWTPSELAKAEMSGAFQAILKEEVRAAATETAAATPVAASPHTASAAGQPHASTEPLSRAEEAVLAVAWALVKVSQALNQSSLTYAQRLVVMDTLRRLFGRSPDDGLERLVQAARPTGEPPFGTLRGDLTDGQRQTLLSQMVHLAMVDDAISDAEQEVLRQIATELRIPSAVANAIAGREIVSTSAAAESGVVCRSCSFDLPRGACFCPSCGTAVA
jgi:uncharacterized tellurite resistance protein B-like protein